MKGQHIYIGDIDAWGVSLDKDSKGIYWSNLHVCGIAQTESYKLTTKDIADLIKWFKKKQEKK